MIQCGSPQVTYEYGVYWAGTDNEDDWEPAESEAHALELVRRYPDWGGVLIRREKRLSSWHEVKR